MPNNIKCEKEIYIPNNYILYYRDARLNFIPIELY